MKRKILTSLIAGAIIVNSVAAPSVIAFATPEAEETSIEQEDAEINELEAKIQNLDELTLQEVIQYIQDYDSKIQYNMEKLNELKQQILDKEEEIKDNQEKLELAQEDIVEKDKNLTERLKRIQLSGGFEATPMQYLEAIFSSGSLLEAIDKVTMISKICASDRDLIKNATEAKDNLEEIKEKIEKESKQLNEDKEYVEKQIDKLEEDKAKLTAYVENHMELINTSGGILVPVTLPSDISEKAKSIINEAQKYLGVPYLWGGTTPSGFDCSGLMQYVFAANGVNIPRISQDQQSFAKPISTTQLKPGDLVFNKSANATHVGMYIGNDMYIHAPHTGDVVKISQLSTSNMKFAGRILDDSTESETVSNTADSQENK